MDRITGILELKEIIEYRQEACEVKDAILNSLYDYNKKRFCDSYGFREASQGVNAIAFQYGLVPDGDKDAVIQYISEKGLNCNTLLSLNLLRVLFENKRQDLALSILMNEESPGWGRMVREAKVPTVRGKIYVKRHQDDSSKVLYVELLNGINGTVILKEGEVGQTIGPGKHSFVLE